MRTYWMQCETTAGACGGSITRYRVCSQTPERDDFQWHEIYPLEAQAQRTEIARRILADQDTWRAAYFGEATA